jgi:hypothetical protein
MESLCHGFTVDPVWIVLINVQQSVNQFHATNLPQLALVSRNSCIFDKYPKPLAVLGDRKWQLRRRLWPWPLRHAQQRRKPTSQPFKFLQAIQIVTSSVLQARLGS